MCVHTFSRISIALVDPEPCIDSRAANGCVMVIGIMLIGTLDVINVIIITHGMCLTTLGWQMRHIESGVAYGVLVADIWDLSRRLMCLCIMILDIMNDHVAVTVTVRDNMLCLHCVGKRDE